MVPNRGHDNKLHRSPADTPDGQPARLHRGHALQGPAGFFAGLHVPFRPHADEQVGAAAGEVQDRDVRVHGGALRYGPGPAHHGVDIGESRGVARGFLSVRGLRFGVDSGVSRSGVRESGPAQNHFGRGEVLY